MATKCRLTIEVKKIIEVLLLLSAYRWPRTIVCNLSITVYS